MPSTEAKQYRVKNLFEAAYLHSKGFPMLGKEPAGGDRKWFIIFAETPELMKAVQDFYAKKSKERELFDSFRMIKDFLFDR